MSRSRRIAATTALAVAGVLLVSAAVLTVSTVSAVFDGERIRCGAPVNLLGAPDIKPVTVTVFGPVRTDLTYDSVTGCGRAKHEREKLAAGCVALAVVASAATLLVRRRGRPPAASMPPAADPV